MSSLNGVRVLVVEDETVISVLLEDMLAQLGCSVVGTAARLQPAMKLARELEYDVALIDLNLGGDSGEAVADVVAERRGAVVYASGYRLDWKKQRVPGAVLVKPYGLTELTRALVQSLEVRRA